MADDLRFDIILNDAKAQASLKKLATTLDKSLKGVKGFSTGFKDADKAIKSMNKSLKTSTTLLSKMSKDLKNLATVASKLPKTTAKNRKEMVKVAKATSTANTALKKQSKASKKVTANLKNQAAAAAQVSSGLKGGLALLFRYGPAAAGAALAIAGIAKGFTALKEIVQSGNEAEAALTGLQSVALATGQDLDKTTTAAKQLVSEGMLTLKESSSALKNLLATGLGLEEAVDVMHVYRDAAIFGRQATLGFGEAIVGATEGLKNDNSVKSDNAGLTENISIGIKRYAKELGKSFTELTKSERAQAKYNAIMREGTLHVGNFEKGLETYAGIVGVAANKTQLVKDALGLIIVQSPAVKSALKAMGGGLDSMLKFVTNNTKAIKTFVKDSVLLLLTSLIRVTDTLIILGKTFKVIGKLVEPFATVFSDITKDVNKFTKQLGKLAKKISGKNNVLSLTAEGFERIADVLPTILKFLNPVYVSFRALNEGLRLLNGSIDIFSQGADTQEKRLDRAAKATERYRQKVREAEEANKSFTSNLSSGGMFGNEDFSIEHVLQVEELKGFAEVIPPMVTSQEALARAMEESVTPFESLSTALGKVKQDIIDGVTQGNAASGTGTGTAKGGSTSTPSTGSSSTSSEKFDRPSSEAAVGAGSGTLKGIILSFPAFTDTFPTFIKSLDAFGLAVEDFSSAINAGFSQVIQGAEIEQSIKDEAAVNQSTLDSNGERLEAIRKELANIPVSSDEGDTARRKELIDERKALRKSSKTLEKDKAAIAAKAQKAQDDALISGISTAVGLAFGPVGGQMAEGFLTILSDPEFFVGFVENLAEALPGFIARLVENIPELLGAIGDATAQAWTRAWGDALRELTNIELGDPFEGIKDTLGEINNPFEDINVTLDTTSNPFSDWTFPDNPFSDWTIDLPDVSFDPFVKAVDKITETFKQFKFPDISINGVTGGGGGDGGTTQQILDALTPGATGGMIRAATGGLVAGPGNRDSVPMLTMPGELIIDRTTGPKLMSFIDSFEQSGQPQQSTQSDNSLILAQILASLEKEKTVTTSVELNQEVFADIMLSLNQDNQRTE